MHVPEDGDDITVICPGVVLRIVLGDGEGGGGVYIRNYTNNSKRCGKPKSS